MTTPFDVSDILKIN